MPGINHRPISGNGGNQFPSANHKNTRLFRLSMKEQIISYCQNTEKEEKVRILFAIEAGSRLWRMDSQDSDYDVRFVFTQPLEKYISVDNAAATAKVINRMDGKIDLSGFDIFKFCQLLLKSNPSVIEWMQSNILYYGQKPESLQKIALTEFNPPALSYHYRSMCQFNYHKYLVSKNEVTYKKYLYAMRGLVNATYVQKNGTLPPIHFPQCLQESQNSIPVEILDKLNNTITLKKQGKEKDLIQNISLYDDYIDDFLKHEPKDLITKLMDKDKINKELERLILLR